jgi:hypothetical protein
VGGVRVPAEAISVSAASPKRRPPEREELAAPDDGAQRVRLRFLPDGAEVRVP